VEFQRITPGTNLKPLFMASTAICNDPTETMNYTGMNTTGLLVAIAGKVTEVECGGIIYIDDGGGFNDQVGNAPGIRVHIPWDVTIPEKGQMVLISGISRIEAQTPGQTMRYVPTIWVRDAGDIKTYNQPQQ